MLAASSLLTCDASAARGATCGQRVCRLEVVTGSAEVEPGRVSLLRVAEEAFLALLIAVIIRLFPCASHRWFDAHGVPKSYGDDETSMQTEQNPCG